MQLPSAGAPSPSLCTVPRGLVLVTTRSDSTAGTASPTPLDPATPALLHRTIHGSKTYDTYRSHEQETEQNPVLQELQQWPVLLARLQQRVRSVLRPCAQPNYDQLLDVGQVLGIVRDGDSELQADLLSAGFTSESRQVSRLHSVLRSVLVAEFSTRALASRTPPPAPVLLVRFLMRPHELAFGVSPKVPHPKPMYQLQRVCAAHDSATSQQGPMVAATPPAALPTCITTGAAMTAPPTAASVILPPAGSTSGGDAAPGPMLIGSRASDPAPESESEQRVRYRRERDALRTKLRQTRDEREQATDNHARIQQALARGQSAHRDLQAEHSSVVQERDRLQLQYASERVRAEQLQRDLLAATAKQEGLLASLNKLQGKADMLYSTNLRVERDYQQFRTDAARSQMALQQRVEQMEEQARQHHSADQLYARTVLMADFATVPAAGSQSCVEALPAQPPPATAGLAAARLSTHTCEDAASLVPQDAASDVSAHAAPSDLSPVHAAVRVGVTKQSGASLRSPQRPASKRRAGAAGLAAEVDPDEGEATYDHTTRLSSSPSKRTRQAGGSSAHGQRARTPAAAASLSASCRRALPSASHAALTGAH